MPPMWEWLDTALKDAGYDRSQYVMGFIAPNGKVITARFLTKPVYIYVGYREPAPWRAGMTLLCIRPRSKDDMAHALGVLREEGL